MIGGDVDEGGRECRGRICDEEEEESENRGGVGGEKLKDIERYASTKFNLHSFTRSLFRSPSFRNPFKIKEISSQLLQLFLFVLGSTVPSTDFVFQDMDADE